MDQKTGDNCNLYRPTNSSRRGIGSASRHALASRCHSLTGERPTLQLLHTPPRSPKIPNSTLSKQICLAQLTEKQPSVFFVLSFLCRSTVPTRLISPKFCCGAPSNLPYNRPASLFPLSAARTFSWKQASNFGACPNETFPPCHLRHGSVR
jgi:hypothetical protein